MLGISPFTKQFGTTNKDEVYQIIIELFPHCQLDLRTQPRLQKRPCLQSLTILALLIA